jgi:ABC-2 type transport system ATP-binding protein
VNGAGKTTLIRILCGQLKSSGGTAIIDGNNVSTDIDKVKKITAVSPQETSVAPNLTVRENLMFFAEVYGYDKQSAKDRSQQIIEKFDLGEVSERRAKTLSGGWQRRLSVAIALVSNPKIIFLDEPTLGMDVLARRELWKIIQSLKGKVTIILTSHYLEEIEHLCDKVAILANGNVMAVGTVDEIKAQTGKDNFEDAFVKIVDTNLDDA